MILHTIYLRERSIHDLVISFWKPFGTGLRVALCTFRNVELTILHSTTIHTFGNVEVMILHIINIYTPGYAELMILCIVTIYTFGNGDFMILHSRFYVQRRLDILYILCYVSLVMLKF